MLETLALIVGLILIGSLTRKTGWFNETAADTLNSFVLNIALPAIIVVSLPNLSLTGDIAFPIGVHWFAFLIHVILLVWINKVFKLKRSVFGALLIVTNLSLPIQQSSQQIFLLLLPIYVAKLQHLYRLLFQTYQ